MIVTYRREKLINAVLVFAMNTKFCGKTKLMKLLYFLDFTHFKQTGKPVTELDYYAWERGPVPKDFFEEISGVMADDLRRAISIKKLNETFEKIEAKIKPDFDYFSPREQRIISDICEIYRDVQAHDISEISHLANQPWDTTKKEKGLLGHIDYLLAVDGKGGSLPRDVVEERALGRREMIENFGMV